MKGTELWALAMLANMVSWGLAPLIPLVLHHFFPRILNNVWYPGSSLRDYLLPGAFLMYSVATIVLMSLTGGWLGALLGIFGVTMVAVSLWNTLYRHSTPTLADQTVILISFLLLSPIVFKLVFSVES